MTDHTLTVKNSTLRLHFLDYLYGDATGFACIGYAHRENGLFKQIFFEWPSQRQELANFIEGHYKNNNVWFCVNLLSRAERKKEFCLPGTVVWADLDYVNPDVLSPPPSAVLETSNKRYQAFWRLTGDPVPADVAEDWSRRIAYKFNADRSGWPLTKLLRVPLTLNHKYDPPQEVIIRGILQTTTPVELLDAIEAPTENGAASTAEAVVRIPMPDPTTLPEAEHVLYHYKSLGKLTEDFVTLYTKEPAALDDWSKIIWRFVNMCLEAGMTAEETFTLALTAACNKYKRDNRPISYLWRDVSKAAADHNRFNILLTGSSELVTMPQLVDPTAVVEDSFIKDYKTWANIATDAPEQYHELTAFIALSSMLSSGLYLNLSWGEFVPNIWGLVLGESTLTRKTTAMRLAVDIIKELDDELILATDGSAEGLLTGLSNRPKRVSIFWKDEVSGLFDSINRKDYLAGLPETLTQLYDVPKVLTRLLRKETITISEPYFIFFGGGIRDKVYSLITDEYVLSGFLPRFLIVSGENDITRLRPTGPPTDFNTSAKESVIRTLADLRDRYTGMVPATILGQQTLVRLRTEAKLTPNAWKVYNMLEDQLVKAGSESNLAMMALPTFTRLGFSMLKLSMLIAATRRLPSDANILTIEEDDVLQAASYITKWGKYSVDLLVNTGKSLSERTIERILNKVRNNPGITKSIVMQHLHLTAREAKEILETMIERGLIEAKRSGPGWRLYPVH